MFVGAIGGMTEQAFYNYFNNIGPVEDYLVFRDQHTGEPKGYGFIVFKEHASVATCIAQKGQHYINGKWIDVKEST